MSPLDASCRIPHAKRCGTFLRTIAAISAISTITLGAEPPHPAAISIDRSLQQPLRDAQSLIERQRFAQAMQSLQPILGSAENHLILVGTRYVDAKVAANRLIAGLSAEGLAAYEREFGGIARHDLEAADAAGRIDDLLHVAASFPRAEAGRKALTRAAGLLFDSGRFLESAAADCRLLENPGSETQESVSAARLITAWMRIGQDERARRWVTSRRQWLANHHLEVGGVSRPLNSWLAERLNRQSSAVPAVLVTGGHPQAIDSGFFQRPCTEATWNRGPVVFSPLSDDMVESVSRRAASGIAPVFHGVPLVVGSELIIRRRDELAAFDLRTGEIRWSHDLSPSGNSSVDSQNGLQDEQLVPLIVEMLVDKAFSGGAHSAISSDGKRVFAVVEDAVTNLHPLMRRRGRRMPLATAPKNSLVAFELSGGKRLWRLSQLPPLPSEDSGRDVDFLGPPLAVADTLYVLGRTADGPNLLELDPADGTIRWYQSLAGFSGFEADAVSSFGPACVPVETGGLLLCPTPEGIVIAVDLLTRACRWAYRTPPTEEPPRLPPRWGRGMVVNEARRLNSWRETLVRTDDKICFFISPRSAAIHALNTDTGNLLWTRTVPSGLFLGPVVDGRLLAVAAYQVFSFDADSGRPVWSAPIPLPAGRGFVSEGKYLLPQAEGGLAAIDVTTGAVSLSVVAATRRLGNLLPLSGLGPQSAAVSLSYDQLDVLPALRHMRKQTAEQLRRKPADTDIAIRLARLDREAGDLQSAERRFESVAAAVEKEQPKESRTSRHVSQRDEASPRKTAARTDVPTVSKEGSAAAQDARVKTLSLREDDRDEQFATARRELFETLLADIDGNPTRFGELAPKLLQTAQGDREKPVALRTIAAALVNNGQRLLALEAFLQLAHTELPAQIRIERGPSRIVAFDREVRADFEDFLRSCSTDERRQVDTRLEQFVQRTLARNDTNGLLRIFDRLRGADWRPPLRERILAALRPEPGFFRAQLELWDATANRETRRAADAWRGLAELYRLHDDRKDAAVCYRYLAAEFEKVRFDDGLSPNDLLTAINNDHRLAREIQGGSSDAWPLGKPDVTTDNQSGTAPRFFQLPVEIVPGSLCERLDVGIDREGRTLRFQGDGQSTYWDLSLPPEKTLVHGVFFHPRGWSVGPLLVVQVGTELFGVSPLDESGEPAPKVFWSVDLLRSHESKAVDLSVRFFPGALGPFGDRVSMTDHLGRPVARVGPVLPGYICCNDRGTLTAFDSLTGRVLWRRTDVFAADHCSGDDSTIVLLDRRSQRLDFLRSLDGKTIAQRATTAKVVDLRWLEGRDAVYQTAEPRGTRVSRADLFDGQTKWSRLFPTGSQLVRLDARRYAVAEADGTFDVLIASTGGLLSAQRVFGAEHCLQVHAISDERRFYVAFSGPFSDPENNRANGQRDDSRNPLVNGVLCALDRLSGRTLWCRRFEDGVFALDQSRMAPFLAFSYRHVAAGDEGTGVAWPILHCIDKRTGRDVYFDRFATVQSLSRTFVETDLGRREVLLPLPDAELRFRYSP